MGTRRDLLRTAASLGLATAVWVPALPRLVRPDPDALADGILARQITAWQGSPDAEIRALRRTNPEWDFMGRIFLVLALVNRALAQPDLAELHREVIDRVLADTLRAEHDFGPFHFLMRYATGGAFHHTPAHSLFVDGELALALGARRLLGEHPRWRDAMGLRVERIAARMEAGPVLSAESYPDECWTFCHAFAAVALALADHLDATGHRALALRWIEVARSRLVHRESGLLVSSYHYDGRFRQGPEGSSIWFAAHCLRALHPAFARDQYDRARAQLARSALGFGWAREWPESWLGEADIDSGPIVPVLGASAASSGHALVAARSFGDAALLSRLLASVGMGAFPVGRGGGLALAAGNVVGDLLIAYGLTEGPLWGLIAGEGR